MTIKDMWTSYTASRSVDMRNRIVVHYDDLAKDQASVLHRKLPDSVSYDEIYSAAAVGLIAAVEAYDPTRPVKFGTFARRRLYGAVIDWLREVDHQGRVVRTFESKRSMAWRLLHVTKGYANDEDTAKLIGIPPERFFYLSHLSNLGDRVYFSEIEDTKKGPWDVLGTREDAPDTNVRREFLFERFGGILTGNECTVLDLYYFEGKTLAFIGDVLGLAESRICQLKKGALHRLRYRMGDTLRSELAA